jgi:hypothetical protein
LQAIARANFDDVDVFGVFHFLYCLWRVRRI